MAAPVPAPIAAPDRGTSAAATMAPPHDDSSADAAHDSAAKTVLRHCLMRRHRPYANTDATNAAIAKFQIIDGNLPVAITPLICTPVAAGQWRLDDAACTAKAATGSLPRR